MRLSTRGVRNAAFVGMLAAAPLARQTVEAGSQMCGPYYCASLCATTSTNGGYLASQNCDDNSCSGSGCTGGGSNCGLQCVWCEVGGWVCS